MKRIIVFYLFIQTLISVIRCDHLENVVSDAATRNIWKPIVENNEKTSHELGNTKSDEQEKGVSKTPVKPVTKDRIQITEGPIALGLQSNEDYIELQELNHPQNTRQKIPTTEKDNTNEVADINNEEDTKLSDLPKEHGRSVGEEEVSPTRFMDELRTITSSMLDIESETERDTDTVVGSRNNNIVPGKRNENTLRAREFNNNYPESGNEDNGKIAKSQHQDNTYQAGEVGIADQQPGTITDGKNSGRMDNSNTPLFDSTNNMQSPRGSTGNQVYPNTETNIPSDKSENTIGDTRRGVNDNVGSTGNTEFNTGEQIYVRGGTSNIYDKPIQPTDGNRNVINNGVTDRPVTDRNTFIRGNYPLMGENRRTESQYYPSSVEGNEQYVGSKSLLYPVISNAANKRPVNVQTENEYVGNNLENDIVNEVTSKNNMGLYDGLYPVRTAVNSNNYPASHSNENGKMPPGANSQFVNRNYNPPASNLRNVDNYPGQHGAMEQNMGSNRQYEGNTNAGASGTNFEYMQGNVQSNTETGNVESNSWSRTIASRGRSDLNNINRIFEDRTLPEGNIPNSNEREWATNLNTNIRSNNFIDYNSATRAQTVASADITANNANALNGNNVYNDLYRPTRANTDNNASAMQTRNGNWILNQGSGNNRAMVHGNLGDRTSMQENTANSAVIPGNAHRIPGQGNFENLDRPQNNNRQITHEQIQSQQGQTTYNDMNRARMQPQQRPSIYNENSRTSMVPENGQRVYENSNGAQISTQHSSDNNNWAQRQGQEYQRNVGNNAPLLPEQQTPEISNNNNWSNILGQQTKENYGNIAPQNNEQQNSERYNYNNLPQIPSKQSPDSFNENKESQISSQHIPGNYNGNNWAQLSSQQSAEISNGNYLSENQMQQSQQGYNGNNQAQLSSQSIPRYLNSNTQTQHGTDNFNGNNAQQTLQQHNPGNSIGNSAQRVVQQQSTETFNGNRGSNFQQHGPEFYNSNSSPQNLQQQGPEFYNGNSSPENLQKQGPEFYNGNSSPQNLQQQGPEFYNGNSSPQNLQQQGPEFYNGNSSPQNLQQQGPEFYNGNSSPQSLQQQGPEFYNGNSLPENLQQGPEFYNGNSSPQNLQQQGPEFYNGKSVSGNLQQPRSGTFNGNSAPRTAQQQGPGTYNGNNAPGTYQQQNPETLNGNSAPGITPQQGPRTLNGNSAPRTTQQQGSGTYNGNNAPRTYQQQNPESFNGNSSPGTAPQQGPGTLNGNNAPRTAQQQGSGTYNGNNPPETYQQQNPETFNGISAQGTAPQQGPRTFNGNSAPNTAKQQGPETYNGNNAPGTIQQRPDNHNANNRAQVATQQGIGGASNRNNARPLQAQGPTSKPYTKKNTPYPELDSPPPYFNEEEGWADNRNEKVTTTTTSLPPRQKDDIPPLNIFTNEISYQRFPKPMSVKVLKEKILGKPLKKLYILEESDTKLFTRVRQVSAIYTMEDTILYVSLLYRNVFSRECKQIKKFSMGKLIGNTDKAMFEKEVKDGKTERVLFFTDSPSDYVYFMSCTDMNTSPYACRDSYYVTLDSLHDPPNQFPWEKASRELRTKMRLSFNDPRFIFNFVLLPCTWGSKS